MLAVMVVSQVQRIIDLLPAHYGLPLLVYYVRHSAFQFYFARSSNLAVVGGYLAAREKLLY